MGHDLVEYGALLDNIKRRIGQAQTRATQSINRQLVALYWDIGRLLHGKQLTEGWGSAVIPRLSRDLINALPEIKGFSERNLKRMIRFYREYPQLGSFVPQTVAQTAEEEAGDGAEPKVPRAVALLTADEDTGGTAHAVRLAKGILQLPWGHNFVLIEKIKDLGIRHWYVEQTLEQGWSRDTLELMLKSDAHQRQGGAINNFSAQLPSPLSELAQQSLKDPYIFDFLTLTQPFREHELETGLVAHLERFMLELGVGFAFVGRQYPLTVGEDDFYLDLLFYHLKLRCFVVIDLKVGAFKPDFAGKMNFYLNVVDDTLRHGDDNPSIGLILCRDKKKVLAEYALRGVDRPIGVSEYELSRALPLTLRSSLPSIEEIEAELSQAQDGNPDPNVKKSHTP